MKVLWFANTPCGATEKLTGQKVTGGGWLYALSNVLTANEDIDLHIAFYWGMEISPFLYNGITYHPILRNGIVSKADRYLTRLKQQYTSIDGKEIKRVLACVRDVNPDIIHFHGSEENFGLAAKFIRSIPTVLSIQGMLSSYYYKLYSGYSKTSLIRNESWVSKILRDGINAKDHRMRKNAEREANIYQYIPNIIGRTAWDRDCSLTMNPSRRYFVCNEILRPEFMAAVWRQPSYREKLVLVTTISHGLYKGLEMVYETARLLTHQQFDFEWTVIGISPGDMIERITRKLTKVRAESVHINLAGRQSASQMVDILRQSNIYIQVSHIENSPNSLCEAMVMGIPIIASYAGGTSSLLQDGVEGTLVQDGDPYRLAGAIITMSRNYSHAVNMGISARKKGLKRHNPENVVNELTTIYQTICKG